MRFGVFVLVAGAVGCAKIESEFEDPGTPVSVLEEGFGRTVVGPGYRVAFHGGEQLEVHLPESLQIGNEETLANGNPNDRLERLVGFGLFPALIATADTIGTVVESDITTNDDGPFVAQIAATSAIEYSCAAPVNTRRFRATSIFTFFPNGRIVRHDTDVQAVADGDTLTNTSNVACNGPQFPGNGQVIFTSFWAFDVNANTVDRNDMQFVLPPDPNPTNRNVPGACTFFSDHSLGLRYQPQVSRVVPNANADAYVLDFLPQTATSVTGDMKFDTVSQVQLRDGSNLSCGEILAQLETPAIRVGSEEVPTTNFDGIYEDPFNPRDQPYTVEVIGDTAVPAGWVLATDPSSDLLRITRSDGSEPDYNVQRLEVGLTRMLIIFNEPLEPGDPITIEPL